MGLGRTQGGADRLEQPQETVAVLQPVFTRVLLDMLCRREDLPSHIHGLQQHNLKAFHLFLGEYIFNSGPSFELWSCRVVSTSSNK
jgi:hypothetical protein